MTPATSTKHDPTHSAHAFRRSDLADLTAHRDELCVSLFLPTEPFGAGAPRNPKRLLDLLDRVATRLAESGVPDSLAQPLLEPARRLATGQDPAQLEFWRHIGPGIAVFLAEGLFHAFPLPRRPRERVIVGSRFALRPVLTLLSAGTPFLIMAISLNATRLLECDAMGPARRLALPDLPNGIDEALGKSAEPRDRQTHSGARAALGHRGGIVHGHGQRRDGSFEEDLLTYFRQVTAALQAGLGGGEHAMMPIVLAAVREYLPLIRSTWADPRLLAEAVVGSPDHVTDEELRITAAHLVETHRHHEMEKDTERVTGLLGSRQASIDPGEILTAAEAGRVELLFVDRDAEVWGRLDPAHREVELHEMAEPGDEEILDRATAEALRTHAIVHAVDRAAMPDHARAAAIFRY